MNQSKKSSLAHTAVESSSLREVTEYDRLLDLYSVTYFSVLDNHTVISPLFAMREQAKQCETQRKARFPDCHTEKFERYFTSEFEKGRQELLTKIILPNPANQNPPPPLDGFVEAFPVVLWCRRTDSYPYLRLF